MKINIVCQIALAVLIFFSSIYAQPQLLNYQGRLTDEKGAPITGAKDLRFSLYEQATSGSAKWTEAQYAVAVTDGVFNVLLGGVDPVNNPLSPALLAANELYFGVAVDGVEMLPRFRLTSVPFAVKAEQAKTAQTHQKVAFSAYVATNNLDNDIDPLPMQAVSNNFGNAYNTSTSKFTAPIEGLYSFTMYGLSQPTFTTPPTIGIIHWYLMINGIEANHEGLIEPNEGACLTWGQSGLFSSRTVLVQLKKDDLVHVKQVGIGRCDNFRSGLEGVLLYADPE